jgi:hypothetical protein
MKEDCYSFQPNIIIPNTLREYKWEKDGRGRRGLG